jgi:hypothetical protein
MVLLAGLSWVTNKSTPRFSLRLLASSSFYAAFVYFLPTLLCFLALRFLPSGFVVVSWTLLPLFFFYVVQPSNESWRLIFILFSLGCLSFFSGCLEGIESFQKFLLGTFICGLAVLIKTTGLWYSRKLFWIHQALDLNFFALLISAVVSFIFAIAFQENLLDGRIVFWSALFFLSFFVGIVEQWIVLGYSTWVRNLSALWAPLLTGVILSWLAWAETPFNVFTILGVILILTAQVFLFTDTKLRDWRGLFQHGDVRMRDRLLCLAEGFLQTQDGNEQRCQLCDLSATGVGLFNTSSLEKNTLIKIKVPIGTGGNFIIFDGHVHQVEKRESKDFPFRIGISFQGINPEKRQALVELLAKVSHAGEW